MSDLVAMRVPVLLAGAGCGHVGLEQLDEPSQRDASSSSASTPDHLDAGVDDEVSADKDERERDAGNESGDAVLENNDAGEDTCQRPPCDAGCAALGVFGLKLTVSVRWQSFAIAPGEGDAHLWLKFDGPVSSDGFTGNLTTCGLDLPKILLEPEIAGEQYALVFDEPLFDQVPPVLPATPVRVDWAARDSSVSTDAISVLMGVRLNDPRTDAWPASSSSLRIVDDDGDGAPGVRGRYLSGNGDVFPPLDGYRTQRADRADFVVRIVAALRGAFTSCTDASGAAEVSAFDTHVVACHVARAGRACTAEERDFLDGYRQVFKIGDGSFTALKLAPDASCAAVRRALP